MTSRLLALVAVAVSATACGASSKPVRPAHAAVPDVRGLNVSDAAVRLIAARYCVRLTPGTRPASDARPKPGMLPAQARMPVEGQSPPAGSTHPTWSMVTLTVGGISRHAATYIAVWSGGARIPCPPIGTDG